MYQALYRKWRPRTFDDVAGQEHITRTLKNELKLGRVSHAYLFTGSRGTGKTTCAKILSKAVNCLDPRDGNPCCECEICRGIDNESVTDIVELDAASNRKIENMRELTEDVHFSPTRARYRVFIIDEVHMLTTEAFNALLKTLEEPPEHVVFVLATTEVHKVPATIRSRCQQFDFHRIPVRAIADRLLYVANEEGLELDDSSAVLIASISDGALRDALSLLDRCVAISSKIDEDVVRTAAGLTNRDYLYDISECIINKNTAGALNIVDRLYSEAKDMARLCSELIGHLRGIMMIKTVSRPRDIIVFTDEEFERAVSQADYLDLPEIIYYMDVLSRAVARMGKQSSDRTELEMALVKLTSPELDVTSEAMLARISALERAVKKGIAVSAQAAAAQAPVKKEAVSAPSGADEAPEEETGKKPANKSEDEAPEEETGEKPANKSEDKDDNISVEKPEPKQEEAKPQAPAAAPPPAKRAAAQKADVPDVVALSRAAKPFPRWPEIVDSLKSVSKAISAAFAGTAAYESGGFILIDSESEMAFELLRRGEHRREIRDILREQTGKSYRLGPYRLEYKDEKAADPLSAFKDKVKESGIPINEE